MTATKTIIFHNPRCSKSREALELLNQNNCSVEIVEYLKNNPTKEELQKIIQQLGIEPFQLIRKSEEIFKEKYKSLKSEEVDWIQAMVEHPNLIERPIVIQNDKAVIGRPPSLVLDLITK